MPQVTWHKRTKMYQSGEDAKVGKWVVGAAIHSASATRDDPNTLQATLLLPGIQNDLGRFPDMAAARQHVEDVVAYWFKWTEKEE